MKLCAADNSDSKLIAREHSEAEESGPCKRAAFQRDRDRIMHSRAFRRMMHKTQIFNANMGDHYRNRLTHTLEVSQIARSIGKALCLNDELIEAIALGHDIGHTPFGHIGERTLNKILSGEIQIHNDENLSTEEQLKLKQERFKHNFQSVRVIDCLERRCDEYSGLNLTFAVKEGILKHTETKLKKGDKVCYSGMNFEQYNLDTPSCTLEGQVVTIADEIAQCSHDLEDGVRSGIISWKDICEEALIKKVCQDYNIEFPKDSTTPTYHLRNYIIKHMVGFLIRDVYDESTRLIEAYEKNEESFLSNGQLEEKVIDFSHETTDMVESCTKQIERCVTFSEIVSASDAKAEFLIKQLFKAFIKHPKQLPDYVLSRYMDQNIIEFDRIHMDEDRMKSDPVFLRAVCDHIAGMTDQFASREYKRLYIPDYI